MSAKAPTVSGNAAVRCGNVVLSGTVLGYEFAGSGCPMAAVAADLVASVLRRECDGGLQLLGSGWAVAANVSAGNSLW
ncbi:hypothetical protein Dimus_007934 [Dionaea muscipula]